MTVHRDDDDFPRIRPDAYGRRIEEDQPTDPEHHTGFFVDVWTDVPLSDYARKTLLQAIESICLDNTEDDYEMVVVEVHEAPVVKDGPNHWEGVL